MGFLIDINFAAEGDVPTLQLSGRDSLAKEQLYAVKFDLELSADDKGNPFIKMELPDRGVTIAESSPLTGELYFKLKKLLVNGSKRPAVVLLTKDGTEDISSRFGDYLFDFSGSLSRARRLANQRRFMEALRQAQSSVEENPDMAGLRVVLARLLVANGKMREAKKPLEEELELFSNSYRAKTELAEIEFKELHVERAKQLLDEALCLYENNLKALLTKADLLFKEGGEDEVIPLLARAWCLQGALDPEHVVAVLKRRMKTHLYEKISAAAEVVSLKERQPSKPAPKTQSQKTFSCSEITSEEVIRMAARDVFRDGTVSSKEKKLFQKICSRFAIGNEKISAIVAEEKSALAKQGAIEGELEPAELFRKILERVYEDGKLSRQEGDIVMGLARSLGLSKDVCLEIKKDVLGQ